MAEEPGAPALPREPIHALTAPIERFLHVEAAGGVVLLIATVVAIALANSEAGAGFAAFWKLRVGFEVGDFTMAHSLKHWINDGLMVVFFFVIGLEVKRELAVGELREPRQAVLPVAAALGGMVVPAGIYLALQAGEPAARGWGIPMATDIAFVVGCLAILGSRIPPALRVLLVSLAIVDDIGAILVIAVGYTDELRLDFLIAGFALLVVIWGLARVGVRSFMVYTAAGIAVWFCFHESGVHATIAGVLLGLMTPARSYVSEGLFGEFVERSRQVLSGEGIASLANPVAGVRRLQRAAREVVSPLEFLENSLHPWVGFAIMPLFALANAGVAFSAADFGEPVALAVAAGLVLGKPIGVVGFSWLAVAFGIGRLPQGVGWTTMVGGGLLVGIGFTMALFIGELALDGSQLDAAKVGILGGSALAALLGVVLLVASGRPAPDAARS
jgi:NhaA family Na+:H+ antiporter